MKISQYILSTIIAVTLCTSITYANDATSKSRREIKLQNRIEHLREQLRDNERSLAAEQYRRGVDTTSTQGSIIVIEPAIHTPVTLDKNPKKVVTSNESATIRFTPLQMDSVLNDWKERESQENFDNFFTRYIEIDEAQELKALEESKGDKKAMATALDSLYVGRIRSLASPIELSYNYIVKNYIDRYVSPRSSLMSNVLARSKYYFPIIEEELIKSDLPVELRSMAIVESALTSAAVSRAGAMGLWQFMPSTGKSYGLEVNYLVDERCDPLKATVAACKFMGDLYRMFGDWTLALAAYNCGPGNVNKAIARSGLKEGTFWDIYHFLPRETRGYVPAFIGASYAYAFHKQHNIESSDVVPVPLATDTVRVNRITHLGQVAEVLELPINVLKELNPQYRRDIIPATTKSYTLRLPQKYIVKYIENEAEIHAKDTLYLKQYINPVNIEKLKKLPNGMIYVVRSGDTLGGIARKYGTSTRQLMVWNNLRSANRISIGQRLRVR